MTATHAHLSIPAPHTAPLFDSEPCPWCGQPISHEKFKEIEAQIAARERQRVVEMEHEFTARVKEATGKAKLDAEREISLVRKELGARLDTARADAKVEAEAALGPKLAAAEGARRNAEQKLATAEAATAKLLETRLREQREILEQAKDQAVNAEKASAFKDRQKLDLKITSLQRQVQQQAADKLGEGAEIDLFEALKSAFPGDDFMRVKKGTPGADIIHKVMANNRECGRIVYDSKNRSAWRNDYVAKLHNDMIAARAEHAILATSVFPRAHTRCASRTA